MKKGIRVSILSLFLLVALPLTAFAGNGAYVHRTNNDWVSYKSSQTFFKMPDSMYLSNSGTYPSVFWTISVGGHTTDSYYNLDVGLQYVKDKGWRFQYFGGTNNPSGNLAEPNRLFEVYSSQYGGWKSSTVGTTQEQAGWTSDGDYGHTPTVLSYSPGQVIRIDTNYVNKSSGPALQMDIFSGSTLLAEAIIPITSHYKQTIDSGMAIKWNRQFNLVTDESNPSIYTNNGSYTFNAKFMDTYLVRYDGAWVQMTSTNSTLDKGFENNPNFSYSGVIFQWQEESNGLVYDNIGFDFR